MDGSKPLRGAVLGLGMIGRHHARILQSDARRRVRRRRRPRRRPLRRRPRPARCCSASIDELLAARRGRTSRSSPCRPRSTCRAVEQLAAAGVHVLVEKPLAATADEAREIIAAVERAGVRGAVGHVERYNPALLAARERNGRARRAVPRSPPSARGPFPARIKDVGVVKDLATHDLDLVRWLGGVAGRGRRRADLAPDGPRARGPRPRHRPPGERRDVQLPGRLAHADEVAPHADPRRARDARRRHARPAT